VVVGRSFEVDRSEGVCKPDDESEPLARIDELYEGKNPFESSIKRASDYEPVKLRVDLVLTGTAYAPGGKPAASWPVVFRVGKWKKELRIVGPRVCKYVAPKKKGKKKEPSPPRFTAAEPISEVALRYENAFGGVGLFVPEDKEAFRAAKQKAEEVEERARKKATPAEAPPVEIPEMSDEQWNTASGSPQAAKKTDGRLISDGEGSSEAGLEMEHLSTSHEGTLELDLDQVEATGGVGSGAGAATGRLVDHEGTPILALAEAGNERVVEEGWSDDLVPDKDPSGGKPQKNEESSEFPRIGCRSNPVGKGFAVCHDRDVIDGLELPLIENPETPLLPENIPCSLQELESAPRPAGFGPLARSWTPRADFAGLDPEQKERVRAKMDEYILSLDPDDPDDRAAIVALADQDLPDHDPRVYNFAPIDQQLGEVRGGELVRVEGVSPDGPLEFKLPGRFPLATLDRGDGEELLGLKLDTIEVDTDEDRVVLIWRGRAEMEDEADLLDYPHVRVRIEDVDPESARERSALQKKDGGTDILEAVNEEDVPEEQVAAPEKVSDGGGAWREGEDREVSPLSDDSELAAKIAAAKDAEAIAMEKRREDVMQLRARIKEAEEAKSKKGKGKKKEPKKP